MWIDTSSGFFSDLSLNNEDQEARLSQEIASAQAAIEKYLGRTIEASEHDEVLPVLQNGALSLTNFPVLSVARICDGKTGVLTINNSTAQKSTCYVTAAGLSLVRITNGVRTNSSISFSTYPTIQSVASAVTALANGWAAVATSGYGSFPSADLVAGQFARTVGNASFHAWEDTSGRFDVSHPTGLIRSGFGCDEVRVVYTAGFDPVPSELCKVLADLAKDGFNENQFVTSESLGDRSYTIASAAERIERLGMSSKKVLSLYRNR